MATLLFTAQDTVLGGAKAGGSKMGAGPTLVPGPHGSSIDVVRDFPWTLTPPSSPAIDEVPYIHLTEYRYIVKQFSAQVTTLLRAADYVTGKGEDEPYKGLYDKNLTSGFTYTIPYFNDSFELSNSWTSIDAGLPKNIGGALESAVNAGITVAELVAAGPSSGTSIVVGEALKLAAKAAIPIVEATMAATNYKVGIIDSPKLWKNSTERSYTVEFPLYNTLDEIQIQRNWELCYLLTYQNMFNKKTYFTAMPPVYYEVYIPGVHYSKASYVSNLKILNKGNIRNLTFNWSGSNKNYNIPDAYVIQLTLQDLLMPSQNQMFYVGDGDHITTSSSESRRIEDAVKQTDILPSWKDIQDKISKTTSDI